MNCPPLRLPLLLRAVLLGLQKFASPHAGSPRFPAALLAIRNSLLLRIMS
jgi:hypothetical protein